MQRIKKSDRIVTAYAETAAGPGWSNSPVWVVVRSWPENVLRIECIQPDEQNIQMRVLYGVSASAHCNMVNAVEAWRRTHKNRDM